MRFLSPSAPGFRTTTNNSGVQGIVSKYVNSSFNGFFLIVQNGRLRGYYSASVFSTAIDVTSTGSVADGFWHHAAMAVDNVGGKLFLDGIQIGATTWTGSAGPPPLLRRRS